MADLILDHLDAAVKAELRRHAETHGRSLEEEVEAILLDAVEKRRGNGSESEGSAKGLGTRIASRFRGMGLEDPIAEWRGQTARPADLEPIRQPRA